MLLILKVTKITVWRKFNAAQACALILSFIDKEADFATS
jgi:hypothetical protein